MKSHFDEYISSSHTLHPKLVKPISKLASHRHIIFYGPAGVGKYTQALKRIKLKSPSALKYEKKLVVTFQKQLYSYKISDIHYEVDMSLLGCNSRPLWHETYQQIMDSITATPSKYGIILCKCFQDIHPDLLDNFYSYMQRQIDPTLSVIFYILTEQLSFLPDHIRTASTLVRIGRPTRLMMTKCFPAMEASKSEMQQIKNLKSPHLPHFHVPICDSIITQMLQPHELQFLTFRDSIYEIFIYNLDIYECIMYILFELIRLGHLKDAVVAEDTFVQTVSQFFKNYNNNYRPIFHVEFFLLFLVNKMFFCNDLSASLVDENDV